MAACKTIHSGMFKKGNPGGPGRPRNSETVTGLIREASKAIAEGDTRTKEQIVADTLLRKAMEGEQWAVLAFLDRMDGKVTQTIQQDIAVQDLSASVSFKKAPIIDVTTEPEQLQPPKNDGPVSG